MIHIEKFPNLEYRGRRLVWDSRQAPDGRPELVFISQAAPADVAAALRARKNAEIAPSHLSLGECASESLGNPSQKLTVVAVTGTNGKTTTVQILRFLLTAAGYTTAELGTLGLSVFAPGEARPRVRAETGFTTPDAPTLHHLFKQLVDGGVSHVAMEASSHAMDLGRVAGTDFDAALFTNLSRDHLDFHGTMEAYENAKAKLFCEILPRAGSSKRKLALLNTKDLAGRRILARVPLGVTALAYEIDRTFGIEQGSLEGMKLAFDDGSRLEASLVGTYNAENLAAAWVATRWLLARDGALNEKSQLALVHALADYRGPAGRMERVSDPRCPARHVFVDYAHTPDALEKALEVLRSTKEVQSKLFAVFGCGGDRDRTKRPLMGAAAARLADRVFVTSDNPRTEDPESILAQICEGVPDTERGRVTCVENRREAIVDAISKMSSGDVCLIAGKGHEDYQIVGSAKYPFSDREEAFSALSLPLRSN